MQQELKHTQTFIAKSEDGREYTIYARLLPFFRPLGGLSQGV